MEAPMTRVISFLGTVVVLVSLVAARPAAQGAAKSVDITGQWTASFDTQIGMQDYTYDFVVTDGKLTGKAKSSLSDAPTDLSDGKVDGDTVTFVETFNFQGNEIRITYAGKITSEDEIKFTRHVAEFATEELVAKRVKK
jgi:hypothetical protein